MVNVHFVKKSIQMLFIIHYPEVHSRYKLSIQEHPHKIYPIINKIRIKKLKTFLRERLHTLQVNNNMSTIKITFKIIKQTTLAN